MPAAIKRFKTFTYWVILAIAAVILLFSAPGAQACLVEWSDASAYDTASHGDGTWQRLGSVWNSEYSPRYEDNDSSDDGVWWSTDGGVTWGHEQLLVGDEVIFGFEVTRAAYGNHDYDNLSAWVDWDGDNVFDDGEQVIDANWDKGDTQVDDSVWWNWYNYFGTNRLNPDAILTQMFFSNAFTITSEMGLLEGLWLRARVACNTSISGDMGAYGYIQQGEVEDWFIDLGTSTSTVPEPGSMVLFGSATAVMAWYRRRKKAKADA